MEKEVRVGLLIIGNEILSGKVQDTNTAWAVQRLREVGARLVGITVVPDEINTIAEALLALRRRADWIITSGGIGPTHDDVTVEAVARAYGVAVVRDRRMERYIRRAYGERVDEMQLKMADVPQGCEIIYDEKCAVPLLCFERTFIFPGIPQLFENCLNTVIEKFRAAPFYLRSVYLSSYEGDVALAIAEVARRHPAVEIGSYPKIAHPQYRVRVTFEAKDLAAVNNAFEDLLSAISPGSVVKVE